MDDSDVYANLSRILETHSFGDEEGDFADFVTRVTSEAKQQRTLMVSTQESKKGSPAKTSHIKGSPQKGGDVSARPTPYETWQAKQKLSKSGAAPSSADKPKGKRMVYGGKQWDQVVDNLYRGSSSRIGGGVSSKEQNSGLAEELTNMDFRPKMNKISLQLSRTMKPLMERIPKLMERKKEMLERKKEQYAQDKFVECTFAPERLGKDQSDRYLKKSGRDGTRMRPEDLFRYEEEKNRRLEERRRIMHDLESKEFTFKPKLNATSLKLKEDARAREVASTHKHATETRSIYDESEAMTKLLRQKNILAPVSRVGEENSKVVPGKILVFESQHPYPHNAEDYRPVCVENALAYSIRFDDETRTEPVYDFIKFFQDNAHDIQWGAGKYTGGRNGGTRNFPGTDGRPALLIPASRFVLHFKSNNRLNAWGYKIYVTPYFGKLNDALGDLTHSGSFISAFSQPNKVVDGKVQSYQFQMNQQQLTMGKPTISTRAQGYSDDSGRSAHVRLYEQGKQLQHHRHNEFADQMQRTIKNVEFRPWERRRGSDVKEYAWTSYKSHTRKELPKWHEYITPAEDVDGRTVFKVCDYREVHYPIWKLLQKSTVNQQSLDGFAQSRLDKSRSFLGEKST